MKLKFLGHAAFFLTSESKTKILIDPYESNAFNGGIQYSPIEDKADVVLITHDHADHNYISPQNKNAKIINQAGKYVINDIEIYGFDVFHDKKLGKERGKNIIYVLKIDDLVICHVGDLGHSLNQETLKSLGKIDILLLPVGGVFTIDHNEATELMLNLQPKICIPMHYKTAKINFPLAKVDEFLAGKSNVKVSTDFEIDLSKKTLPAALQILVLKMAN
jgi:L-ascorbate metabolism protein UlaG (beta-lactamase superfamily)